MNEDQEFKAEIKEMNFQRKLLKKKKKLYEKKKTLIEEDIRRLKQERKEIWHEAENYEKKRRRIEKKIELHKMQKIADTRNWVENLNTQAADVREEVVELSSTSNISSPPLVEEEIAPVVDPDIFLNKDFFKK